MLVSAAPALAQRMRAGDSFKDKVAAWRGDAQVSGKITDEAGKGIPEAKVKFIRSYGVFLSRHFAEAGNTSIAGSGKGDVIGCI